MFYCHTGRTKKMATEPGNPFVYWSSAEDGVVRQMDRREAHACVNRHRRCEDNILIDLTASCAGCGCPSQPMVGIKSIEICPSRPQACPPIKKTAELKAQINKTGKRKKMSEEAPEMA